MSSVLEKFTHTIHEYERSKDNKKIYRCVHPKCMHYIDRQFLIGKEAICAKCKNPFYLTLTQLRNKKPVCEFCTKSPKAKQLKEFRDIAESLVDDLPEELKEELTK